MLEEKFPETVETQPELLAHHYTEAGLIEKAIPYWQKAGQKAIKRSANSEAINYLNKGLELLKTMPEGPERSREEITIQISLGNVLAAAKSYTAPEAERAYSRARKLCDQVGETSQIFPALFGLCTFYRLKGEIKKSDALAKEFLHLAQLQNDPTFLLMAHRGMGLNLFSFGELVSAREHLEKALAPQDSEQYSSVDFQYSVEPRIAGLPFLATILWCLGYPDQALEKSREAVAISQEFPHHLTIAQVLGATAWFYQLLREENKVKEWAEETVELSTEQGLPVYLGWGKVLLGWALAQGEQEKEATGQISQGLDTFRASGAAILQPYFLYLHAEASGKAGRTKEGLNLLEEALGLVEKNGERIWEAELYRLKGELLKASSSGSSSRQKVEIETEAEECFYKAIEVARRQEAKSLELRAAMSLSRLWKSQGKKEEARKLLGEIYQWFTEGFDTKDLKEAKVLLVELS